MAVVYFRNIKTNKIIERKVGFSWTMLFFHIIPLLFRKRFKDFIIIFITSFILNYTNYIYLLWIFEFAMACVYNNFEIRSILLNSNWKIADQESVVVLKNKGFEI